MVEGPPRRAAESKAAEKPRPWNEVLDVAADARPHEILGIPENADLETAKKAANILLETYLGENNEVVAKTREAYDYFVKKQAAYTALDVKPDALPHQILGVAADASQEKAKEAYSTLVKLHELQNPKLHTFIVAILEDAYQNFSPTIETTKTEETNGEKTIQTWYEVLGVAENAALHEILGIAANASLKEAKAAYAALLRKHKAGSHQRETINDKEGEYFLRDQIGKKLTAAYEHFKQRDSVAPAEKKDGYQERRQPYDWQQEYPKPTQPFDFFGVHVPLELIDHPDLRDMPHRFNIHRAYKFLKNEGLSEDAIKYLKNKLIFYKIFHLVPTLEHAQDKDKKVIEEYCTDKGIEVPEFPQKGDVLEIQGWRETQIIDIEFLPERIFGVQIKDENTGKTFTQNFYFFDFDAGRKGGGSEQWPNDSFKIKKSPQNPPEKSPSAPSESVPPQPQTWWERFKARLKN